MFKKKDVKKFDDIPENNNSSGDSNELSLDELDNVAGGARVRVCGLASLVLNNEAGKVLNKVCYRDVVADLTDKK